jgi:hypothetical protein
MGLDNEVKIRHLEQKLFQDEFAQFAEAVKDMTRQDTETLLADLVALRPKPEPEVIPE